MALPHAEPGQVWDLRPLGPALADAKPTALVKTDRFEVIRLVVHAGASIPPHDVPGNIMLHCLEGRVALRLQQSAIRLGAGEWVWLARGETHTVEGIEDSALLMTILFEDGAAGSGGGGMPG